MMGRIAAVKVVVIVAVTLLGRTLAGEEVVKVNGGIIGEDDVLVHRLVSDTVGLEEESKPMLRRRRLSSFNEDVPSCSTFANATISGRNIHYCYPPSLRDIKADPSGSKPVVVVGVLSAAKNKNRRDLIRDTWARGDYHVYFLVSGEWSDVAEEVIRYGDVFWVNATEAYRMVTYKVHVLLHAVHTLSGGYDHVFKTDDDSYVNMDGVELFLGQRNPDYWGRCVTNTPVVHYPQTHKWYVSRELYPPDTYPPYALGGGYSLSKSFNDCVVSKLAEFSFMPNEDAGVGILAEKCNVACTSDIRIRPTNPKPVVLYGLQQDRDLDFLHELKQLST